MVEAATEPEPTLSVLRLFEAVLPTQRWEVSPLTSTPILLQASVLHLFVSALPALPPHFLPPHQPTPPLMQLSVLRLFETVLSDTAIKRHPEFQDLLGFAKGVVRNMFAR